MELSAQLLKTIEGKLYKLEPFKEDYNRLESQFARLDFDSKEDYLRLFAIVKNKIVGMVALIASEQVYMLSRLDQSRRT